MSSAHFRDVTGMNQGRDDEFVMKSLQIAHATLPAGHDDGLMDGPSFSGAGIGVVCFSGVGSRTKKHACLDTTRDGFD